MTSSSRSCRRAESDELGLARDSEDRGERGGGEGEGEGEDLSRCRGLSTACMHGAWVVLRDIVGGVCMTTPAGWARR
jgi:hypothetical protein